MITIVNNTFVKTKSELKKAEADPNLNVIGFYKKLKNGIELCDLDKIPFVFIVNNRYKEIFFVSMSIQSGKKYYMHALTSAHESKLGFVNIGYNRENEIARKAVADVAALNG